MLKIILTGPESSGKTTLARQLAKHFNVPLVEEYARTFFSKKETPHLSLREYLQEDLIKIAEGQLNNELKIVNNQSPITHRLLPILICDTDLLTLKIWSNEVFENCSLELTQLIDSQLINHPLPITQHYFLCSPEDVEWENDPLRENPYDRDRLFNIYEKELKFYEKNYTILRGNDNERFDKAVTKINRLLKNPA